MTAAGKAMLGEEVSSAAADSRPGAQTFIGYLHLFRGVAILQILLLHAAGAVMNRGYIPPLPGDHPASIANNVLFHDATIYFTLISGILFARLFANRPFTDFYKARLINVGTPYLAVTLGLTLLVWLAGVVRHGQDVDLQALAGNLGYNLLTGDAWNTLWYIPVILGLYLISPLLLALLQHDRRRLIIPIIILAPFLFSRTGTDLSLCTFIYFTGAYVLGLWVGADLERRLDGIARHVPVLGAVALATTALLTLLFIQGIDALGPVSLRESLFYAQKLALAGLIVIALRRWQAPPFSPGTRLLETAATLAFGIYFLHGPLVRLMARSLSPWMSQPPSMFALGLNVALAFLGGLALSWLIIQGARLVMGKRSRLVIGS